MKRLKGGGGGGNSSWYQSHVPLLVVKRTIEADIENREAKIKEMKTKQLHYNNQLDQILMLLQIQ